MLSGLLWPLDQGQGEVLKRFQPTRGRGPCRVALRMARLQPGPGGPLSRQGTASDTCQPRPHAPGDGPQANAPGGMVLSRPIHRCERPRASWEPPHTPLHPLGTARGQHRWLECPRLPRWMRARPPPPPPTPRCRHSDRSDTDLDGRLTRCFPPRRPTPGRAHRTRGGVWGPATPSEVLHALPLPHRPHRLTSNRHRLPALVPAAAVVACLPLRSRLGHAGSPGRRGRWRLPHRAHHQPPRGPTLHLAAHCRAPRPGVLLACRAPLRLALGALPEDRGARLCPTPHGFQGRGARALGPWARRQRAPGHLPRGHQQGPRLTRRPLAVAHLSESVAPSARRPPLPTGHGERRSGSLTRPPSRGHRPPPGSQHRLPHVARWQGGARSRAVPTRAAPPFRHRGRRPGAGALDRPPCGGPVIPPPRGRVQSRGTGRPRPGVPPAAQHDGEPLSGAIAALDRLARRGPTRPQALGHPGGNRHEPGVPPRHPGAEPDGAHPTQAEPLPVPGGGTMVVAQRR